MGNAPCGRDALELTGQVEPAAVLIDLCLPDGPGLDLGRRMLARRPGLHLVGLSTDEGRAVVPGLARAGFGGCVSKHSGIARIIAALRPGGAGVWETIEPWRRASASPTGHAGLERLTRRERKVLALVAQGLRSQTIADHLDVELNTVRSHVQMILSKLQVHSRFEAAMFALR